MKNPTLKTIYEVEFIDTVTGHKNTRLCNYWHMIELLNGVNPIDGHKIANVKTIDVIYSYC